MTKRTFIIFLCFFCSGQCAPASAKLVISCRTAESIELLGFNSLAETSVFKGELAANKKHEINTSYQGLALLVFAAGQSYPVIIGDKPLP